MEYSVGVNRNKLFFCKHRKACIEAMGELASNEVEKHDPLFIGPTGYTQNSKTIILHRKEFDVALGKSYLSDIKLNVYTWINNILIETETTKGKVLLKQRMHTTLC